MELKGHYKYNSSWMLPRCQSIEYGDYIPFRGASHLSKKGIHCMTQNSI